eukprot:scaffold8616_cov76-Phaeocystis_antarctica.AAC.9
MAPLAWPAARARQHAQLPMPFSRIAPAVLRENAALLLPAAAVAGATQSPTRAQPELSHTTQ